MRILIVDDDDKNRKLLKAMLTSWCQCDTAASGKDAISAFKTACQEQKSFDVIFLDILMPEMDGEQVLLQIREIEKEKDISQSDRTKIVMVTAVQDKQTVIACLQKGCDGYILKPLDKQKLFSKLESLGFSKEAQAS